MAGYSDANCDTGGGGGGDDDSDDGDSDDGGDTLDADSDNTPAIAGGVVAAGVAMGAAAFFAFKAKGKRRRVSARLSDEPETDIAMVVNPMHQVDNRKMQGKMTNYEGFKAISSKSLSFNTSFGDLNRFDSRADADV